jgi:Peptidase A4 family
MWVPAGSALLAHACERRNTSYLCTIRHDLMALRCGMERKEVWSMVNTLLRHSRLLVALTSGCLVLAMAVPVASSAVVHSVAPSGVTNFTADPANHRCGTTSHDSCNWAGNEAFDQRGTYRVASVEFRIPTISGNNLDHISFWAGVGGDEHYAGSSNVLVQAGVDSKIEQTGPTQFMQVNYAWYEIATQNGTTLTGSQTPVNFSKGLNPGDRITVTVSSNYHGDQDNEFSIKNEDTGESHGWPISGPLSDSATGECIGERVMQLGVLRPIAEFNPPPSATPHTVWLNACVISTDQATHPVGIWPTNWYHIVNTSSDLLVGIGGIDSNGSFPLHWIQAA